MVQVPWRQPPLTREQENDLFMLLLADDTEDAPWLTMGDLQFWSASGFAHSLRNYARARGLGWYVASMLPIAYEWPSVSGKRVLSPDTFVAFVAERARSTFDVAAEGHSPPFILEVVSPSSAARDQVDKRIAYELVGAREYALFTPREGAPSTLEGYRRGAGGGFEPWLPDERGRLWSATLGLYLTVRGALLRAETAEGQPLPTPDEAGAALRDEQEARQREREARRRAEEEVARLRCELERYRGQGGE